MAAASLGYRVHLLSSGPHTPAAQVCAHPMVGDWRDERVLEAFASSVDLLLFAGEDAERQAGDAERLEHLAALRALHPSVGLLNQTRGGEGLQRALKAVGVGLAQQNGQAYRDEISVLVARNADGQIAIYDPALTHRIEGMLDTTQVPAPLESQVSERAIQIARSLARELDLVGLLAVEMAVDEDAQLWVRRLVPRASAAGYWTLSVCLTDQFEQWIRAVCNLPLGSPRRHSDANAQSLIGPIGHRWAQVLREDPEAQLFLYGDPQPTPGSESGHITRLFLRSAPDYSFLGAR